ncbi:hypothetical protein L6R52_36565 [Myxococcota bacterium]|nr:hypothetical protein [Myxococcota bacterium]
MGVVLLLLGLAAPAAVHADARTPSILIVTTPRGLAHAADSSALILETARVIEARSGLRVLSIEQSGVDVAELERCPPTTLLGCMIRAVGASTSTPPAFLFVLSARATSSGRARLSLLTLDVRESLDELAKLARGADAEEVEDAIFASAASGEPRELDPADEDALRDFLDGQLDTAVRAPLERRDEWAPFGRITLAGTWAGASIAIDDRVVGVTDDGATELDDVRPGVRRLQLDDGAETVHLVLRVERGAVARATVQRADRSTNTALAWAGAGLAIAGAVVVGVAAATTAGELDSRCLTRAPIAAACDAPGFATFGFDPSSGPTTDVNAVNPPGLRVVPLGLGLITTGGAFVVGPRLLDGEVGAWISVITGVALGALTYGVTSLAGG